MSHLTPEPEDLLDHTGQRRPTRGMELSARDLRLALAFHETGHAVLGMAYGMRVERVDLFTWQDSPSEGLFATGATTWDAHGIRPWRFAAQCAAGEAAQGRFLRERGLWTAVNAAACESVHDRELAIDVLAEAGLLLGRSHAPAGGKSWATIQAVARRSVALLWPRIHRVAFALEQHNTLTGDEVARLAGLINPAPEGGA
ncbi:hypothetical protein [Streptomyces antimicrobicus]|uniref:Peptidase M41 domain-containing protein n=1 Tax=Streptomyces antimicrobicus TaxID=2883108 RepID=A0ABS8AZM5_9ACTN|nr:hypothetical protein [Streptomyces antimicrobicus]MCB5177794.1 hypothetical protein [Streptomyces antimicrobicus]